MSLWGTDGSNNNAIDDWAAVQAALNQTQLNACWATATGIRHVVYQPLFGGSGVRMRGGIFKAHPTLWGPVDANNGMFMSSQNNWQTFTASAATDTFTTPANHGIGGAGNKVTFNAPQGQTLPGGITGGRVYFVASVPTSTTFTISATSGGATLDVTSDGAGITYTDVCALERIFFDDVYFSGNSRAVNGVMCALQQPAYTKGLRIDGCTGVQLILDGQISNHYNSDINATVAGGATLALTGAGHNFHGLNAVGANSTDDGLQFGASLLQPSGAGAYCHDCHIDGLWTESVGNAMLHFLTAPAGVVVSGWRIAYHVGSTGVLLDAACGTQSAYAIYGPVAFSGGGGFNVLIDNGRGITYASTKFPNSTIGSLIQPANASAPLCPDLGPLQSGALPTTTFVSGTGKQISTTRTVYLVVPVTFNPTAGAAATCLVEMSPDNVTYSALETITEPAGIALDGTIHSAALTVPIGWYVRLTVTNATIGTGTFA